MSLFSLFVWVCFVSLIPTKAPILERLHYHVATNLDLLRANMTHEFNQKGATYHWKPELFRRMNLPINGSVAGEAEHMEKDTA